VCFCLGGSLCARTNASFAACVGECVGISNGGPGHADVTGRSPTTHTRVHTHTHTEEVTHAQTHMRAHTYLLPYLDERLLHLHGAVAVHVVHHVDAQLGAAVPGGVGIF
jgi:hypothetical protein